MIEKFYWEIPRIPLSNVHEKKEKYSSMKEKKVVTKELLTCGFSSICDFSVVVKEKGEEGGRLKGRKEVRNRKIFSKTKGYLKAPEKNLTRT